MKSLILSALVAATAAFGAAPASAQSAAKNVVLVHGAFADETSWDAVAKILKQDGYKVTEVKNPLTSLADDVAATEAVLAAQNGPTVLVGHSWGGVIIGEAGDDPKVKSLVYVSAFAPDKGESLGALAAKGPATEGVKAIVPDQKGFLSVKVDAFPKVFAADLPAKEAARMAAKQLPLNHTAFEVPAAVAAWHAKPTWYVVSGEDKMIDPATQNFFAQRMKATTTTVAGSHSSLISHAKEVARVIEKAAK